MYFSTPYLGRKNLAATVSVYITFLTFGYCIQHDSMLRLDIIKEVLPKKSLGCTSGYSYPNLSSIFLIMLLYSFDLLQSMRETGRVSAALGIPYFYIYLSTTVGFALALSVQHSVSGVLSQGILKRGGIILMTAAMFLAFILFLILSFPVAIAMGLSSCVPALIDSSFSADFVYIIRTMVVGIDSTLF